MAGKAVATIGLKTLLGNQCKAARLYDREDRKVCVETFLRKHFGATILYGGKTVKCI